MDKGISTLIDTITEYAVETSSTLTNNQLMSRAVGVGAKIWLTNMAEKQPYKTIISGFIDNDGNITSHEELFAIAKEMLKDKPIVMWGIKFNHKDIDSIQSIFEKKL